METTPYQSTKRKLKSDLTAKSNFRNLKFITGVVIIIILITAPFSYHIYLKAPADSETWQTIFGTINSGGFASVQSFLYLVISKLYIFLIFSIWFLTNKYWWKWSLIVGIAVSLNQLLAVINDSVQVIDEYEIYHSLPIIIPVIIFQIYVAKKLSYLNETLDVKEQIDAEIESFINENA